MNGKAEVLDATDDECQLAALAILAGSDKTADELIRSFRAAKASPAGVACNLAVSAAEADRAVDFAKRQATATISSL